MGNRSITIDQLRRAFGKNKADEKEHETSVDWQIIAVFYINTLDYDINSTFYHKGLELLHTETMALCANIGTEQYFDELIVEEGPDNAAIACGLDKVLPGFYKCVCGVTVVSSQYSSYEGTEYDVDLTYEMISRTKMSSYDVNCLIEEHKIYPTDEEFNEIVSNIV